MEFCPKCGCMILITDEKAACASCGYKLKKAPKVKSSEKIQQADPIAIIKDEGDTTQPIVEIKCTKCKHDKCYFWTMQTRASDESETKFYKCVKCKHTWRVYR